MSAAPVDIAVFSRDRHPVLIVEVEDSALYATPESAARLRGGLMRHDLVPVWPFFMLATPINIFLWHGDAIQEALPAYSASAQSILESYAPSRAHSVTPVRGAFEIVVFFWLSNLLSAARPLSPESELDRMLLESGLYAQIRGGTADFDVQL